MKPKILLIGDSIRMGYYPIVKESLIDLANVIEIPESGEDSKKVLKNIQKWIKQANLGEEAIIHLNCGLHDIKRKFWKKKNQQPIKKYKSNLEKIVKILKENTDVKLIWATTTPVIFKRHHERKGFDRHEEDVTAYNEVALDLMKRENIEINDLYNIIMENKGEECIGYDGVHMTETGNKLLGKKVVAILKAKLEQK